MSDHGGRYIKPAGRTGRLDKSKEDSGPFIVIRQSGDMLLVDVCPPFANNDFQKQYENYKDAYGYAAGIRMIHQLKIVDQTSCHKP
jgi:hypothetical protein